MGEQPRSPIWGAPEVSQVLNALSGVIVDRIEALVDLRQKVLRYSGCLIGVLTRRGSYEYYLGVYLRRPLVS